MKYIHKKGLQLQKPSYLKTPNQKIKELLQGKEVELDKEILEEFESLGVEVIPASKAKPKKKKDKE